MTEWWWPPGRRGRAVPHHLTVCSGLGGSVCGHTQACRAAVRVGAGSHVRLSLRFQQGQRAERAQACPARGCFCWRARAASTGLPFCPWGRAEPPTPARPRLTCVSASRWGSMVSHDRCRSWQWQRWFPRIGRQLCLHTRLPAAVTGNEAAQKPGRGRAGGRRAPRAPWRCAGPWSPVRTGLRRGLCSVSRCPSVSFLFLSDFRARLTMASWPRARSSANAHCAPHGTGGAPPRCPLC